MTAAATTAAAEPSRQIPAHRAEILLPRRHDHILVIPVINEGERIRVQLARVAAANLPVDVIVADGGSTDGSLDQGPKDAADHK